MKILLFTENSYAGGLDSFIETLIDHWPDYDETDREPDELVLICNRSHPGLTVISERTKRKIKIVAHEYPMHWLWVAKMNARPLPGFIKKGISALSRYPFFLYWLYVAKKLLADQQADRLMVINGGYPAGDSCRAAAVAWSKMANGKPDCIFNFHNFAVSSRWWERWIENVVDGLVVNSCKRFVAVSKACAESMTNRPIIASSEKVDHIYNGIRQPGPPSPEAARTLKEEFGIADDAPICLMLGTYEPRKGHDFLLRSFARVVKSRPMALLLFCGFGYEPDFLKVTSMVQDMGLDDSVFLEGFRDDVPDLIDAVDILLVSSQAFESFGLIIVEAMARSTPVVATNIGGIPEVIGENKGGYCVAANNSEGFAAHILSLLDDGGLYKKVGETGYDRYKNLFTAERMAKEYADMVRTDI